MKPAKHRPYLLKFLEPFVSTIFWLLLFLSPLFFGKFEDGIDWTHIFGVWRSFVPYLFLFLVNRFVFLPFLFFRNRRWLFFISNLALILILAVGVHLYRTRILMPPRQENRREALAPLPGTSPPHRENLPPPGRENHPQTQKEGRRGPAPQQPPRQLPPFVSFIVISILVIGFDTGLMLSVKWARSEQLRIQAEKDNVENQLAFLRNQVSPHFFMNTLNNIHSLIDIDTTEAKESIIKLSKLMRHLLYESEVEQIPLKKEIEFIQNYVELMELRYSDRVQINLKLPGQLPDRSIPPLLYTSFVENAFKHGISYQESSFITIAFFFEAENLVFEIKNSNPRIKREEESSGIGIENSRKRLDLIYGNLYTLDITDGEDEFSVILSIPV